MRFVIPINDNSETGESQTCHVVDTGSDCPKTNKRKLRQYFIAMGVPTHRVKFVMKAMGFVDPYMGKSAKGKIDARANREAGRIRRANGL